MPGRNLRRFFAKFLRQPAYAVRVAAKRANACKAYHFSRSGKSPPPESITLFLTHRCNLHCKMCGQWGEGGVTRRLSAADVKRELPLKILVEFIAGTASFRPAITLFGGEPLLYPWCVPLIEHIKKKKMHCLMITNGSLLSAFAEKIVSAGLDELNVSLDGDGPLHDEIRGMPGLFARISAGLKEVNRQKQRLNRKKPLLNLQCTITRYNYRHLEKMTGIARETGAASLTFHNLIFLEKERLQRQKKFDELLGNSSREWEGFVFEPGIDAGELNGIIARIRSRAYPFSMDFFPNFSAAELREYYHNPAYHPREYAGRCISPWIVAYVFPDGEVRPCLNFSYSFGNVLREPFAFIWNSEKAVSFRRALRENRIFPACVRCTELYRY